MSSVYQHSPGNLRGSNDDSPSGGSTTTLFDNPILEAFTCSGWVLLLFYCVLCKRTQQPNTTVGDRIRARAQVNLERAQRQIEKEKQSPEERRKIVHESLRTKRVLSQNDEGVWTLGDIEDLEDNIEKDFASNDNSTEDDEEDEEDHTCVICLEPFLPKDVVSWSRYSQTCTHVFHSDCIRPWLEDKKQDECPSCRSVLVCYDCKGDGEEDTSDNDSTGSKKNDSLYVIMHGLISQAIPMIRSTSYNLVSGSSSFDSEDSRNEHALRDRQSGQTIEMTAPPSPLRRVSSYNSQSANLSEPVEFRQVVSDLSWNTNRRSSTSGI